MTAKRALDSGTYAFGLVIEPEQTVHRGMVFIRRGDATTVSPVENFRPISVYSTKSFPWLRYLRGFHSIFMDGTNTGTVIQFTGPDSYVIARYTVGGTS